MPPSAPALRAPRPRTAPQVGRLAAIGIAFAAGLALVLAVFVSVALGIASANTGRVMPGVHVGAVDVSGLTRDEAVNKLSNAYSYLAQGDVEITTPAGTSAVTYSTIGRSPNAEAMADAALGAGRTGDPLTNTLTTWRSLIGGQEIPVAIRINPEAVSESVRSLTLASALLPRDAEATLMDGTFTYWPSAQGSVIDEDAISQAIVAHLTEPNAPARFQVGSALVTLEPKVSDAAAKRAIETAEHMAIDVTLTLDPSATPSPAASGKTPVPTKTYVIPAATICEWIVFSMDGNDNYGPSLDMARVHDYIAALPGAVIVAPKEPRVIFDEAGAPVSLEGGKDGLGVLTDPTAQAIQAYLMRLAGGGSREPSLSLVTGPIPPLVGSVTGLTVMGGGDAAWTTGFIPGETNGNGANIRVPAVILNGQIVAPGQQFSFLTGVGPIDQAHGFTWGGVIVHGKSDHTGAMGGGICSASTTMFNAALRAGLQIDERHAHAYYIDRYPAGLDATVYGSATRGDDLRWTNDTPNPIVIRAWATNKGSRSTITIQLWSLPINRNVVLDYPPTKVNMAYARDTTVYVTTLPPGVTNRAEWPTNGYDIVRTRTVHAEDGTLLHVDTWTSHYIRVDGILQIGVAGPTPTP